MSFVDTGITRYIHAGKCISYLSTVPKLSVSDFMSYLKGKSALMFYDRHPEVRARWGDRHLWARGYYVSTVGNVNEETIRTYIREQEENDKIER